MRKGNWTEQQIRGYFDGLRYSDYPFVFWEKMRSHLAGCCTLTDVGCGPGAFALKALEEGFAVQAVDINEKNLEALAEQVKQREFENMCRIIHGDWLEVKVEKSDVTVCAYSMGGRIGTPEGIKRIIAKTKKAAFFITPCEGEQTDFCSQSLYKEVGLKPPYFKGDHRDIVNILEADGHKVQSEIIEYDFGLPLKENEYIDTVHFLAEKLDIPSIRLVEEHIKRIRTVRNGMHWIPNPRTSAMITYIKEDNHDE